MLLFIFSYQNDSYILSVITTNYILSVITTNHILSANFTEGKNADVTLMVYTGTR